MINHCVIIGAANIDIVGTPKNALVKQDSNRGTIHKSHGGVGRNIAENLGKLGLSPHFITELGRDEEGINIALHLKQSGVILYDNPIKNTSSYLAINNELGDLFVAVNAMDPMSLKTVMLYEKILNEAKIIVLDLNVGDDVIKWVLKNYDCVYIDAVSNVKAQKIMPYLNSIHTLKLNLSEAKTLTKLLSDDSNVYVSYLLNQGVHRVFLTLGEKGVVCGDAYGITHVASISYETTYTIGAGDAFLAGVIYGDFKGLSPLKSGLAMASLSLQSSSAVNEFLDEFALLNEMKKLE